MNSTKFNKYLKKINSFEGLVDDIANLSLIEKDLLKDYIKKLYESVSEEENTEKKTKKQKKISSPEKSKKQITIIKDTQVDTKVDTKPEEITTIEAPVVTKTDNLKNEEVKELKTEETVKNDVDITKEHHAVSQEFLELFDTDNSNELSQKLSLTPIKNLSRAFSINEKIFTVKELFGGDDKLFNRVLEDIDGMSHLDDAKDYLIKNIVDKLNWDEPKMLKKVKGFVSIVKRRFL